MLLLLCCCVGSRVTWRSDEMLRGRVWLRMTLLLLLLLLLQDEDIAAVAASASAEAFTDRLREEGCCDEDLRGRETLEYFVGEEGDADSGCWRMLESVFDSSAKEEESGKEFGG